MMRGSPRSPPKVSARAIPTRARGTFPVPPMSRLLHFCLLTLLFASEGGALDLQQRLIQLHHQSWTARDGLTGSPLCLAQTADGFLWIGTSDGLFHFDGVQFERFRPEAGELPAVSVSAILAVPDGLWVGYSRGRASFISHDGRVVNYSDREGLPFGKVRSFTHHDGPCGWRRSAAWPGSREIAGGRSGWIGTTRADPRGGSSSIGKAPCGWAAPVRTGFTSFRKARKSSTTPA